MSELLTKYLAARDTIHRGRTPWGIANGLRITAGRSFPRIRGGYLIYRGLSTATIDRDNPVGAAGFGTRRIEPFPWVAHEAGDVWYYELVPIGAGGVECPTTSTRRIVRVVIDGEGLARMRPATPRRLTVAAAAGGTFRLSWTHLHADGNAVVSVFRVYNDAGTGTVDYETVVATLAARKSRLGSGDYAWASAAFADAATIKWAVRAESASGQQDAGTTAVEATAETTGPASPAMSLVATGGDE